MHFDNYLQKQNIQPIHSNFNKFAYSTTQNNNNNSCFRQNITQHNLNFNRAPNSYAQSRPESSRQAIESNFNSSLLKKGNPQPKPVNPVLPFNKPQVTVTNNYINLTSNSQRTADQKKYICLSPAKQTSKVSSGLEQPQTQQSKIEQRRSESVTDPRLKDFQQNSYLPWCRQSTGALGMTKQTTHTTPFQINFSNTQLFPEKSNLHIERKESTEKSNFFKTFESQWNTSQNLKDNSRINPLQQTKNEKPYFFPQKRQSQAITSTLPFNDSFYKQPSTTLTNTETASNKEPVRQDFLKQYSTSKNLVFIEKDIEKLKNASKRVDEVYQNQLNKNYYFNKFLEEKGIKTPDQEKLAQLKDLKTPKDLEKRIENLQKQLTEKQNQLFEKNKEISERSKAIIDKNKVIDSLSIELRQTKSRLEARELELKDKEMQLVEKKENLQTLITLRKSQELFYQQIMQYNKRQEKDSHTLQFLQKESSRLKLQVESKIQQNQKLVIQKNNLRQKLILLEQKTHSYKGQIEVMKQKCKLHLQELRKSEAKLQSQQQKAIMVEKQLQEIKKQSKSIENISYQNLPSSQMLQKQEQYNRSKQELEKLTQRIAGNEAKLNELSIILLNKDSYDHQSVIFKLKQLKESILNTQMLRQKEQQRVEELHIQRLHQEYLQKKFNELSREFKKINNKYCLLTNQAQQGWRLLREANNQIVLLNLQRLNQLHKRKTEQNQ